MCFVISGTICGLAGALLANNTDFVSPATMYWTRSGDLMVMVILGGMGSLFGPVIGAIVFLLLEELLSQFTEYWALIMGPMLLLIVLFARGGIMGLLGRAAPWLIPCSASTTWCGGSAASSPPTISRSTSCRGELHAIIGPNGAGKTTLISQLTGQLTPNSGTIHFAGQDITRLPALSAQPAGAGALVPDHLAAARFHRCRQCRARGAGA